MKNRAPTKLPVLAFTPVPRKRARYDGWTAARQAAFLDALAETGSVKHAALRIKMAAEGAYALRRQPGAESFAAAWDAALDHGVQTLRDLAIDHARDGIEVPVYSYGKLVGTRRVYNDHLLMFVLKHRLGRLGADDPLPLRPGTKSRRTIAREEDEAKARWLEEKKDELVRHISPLAALLVEMAERLRDALAGEAAARQAGLFEAEDAFRREIAWLFDWIGQEPQHWAASAEAHDAAQAEISAAREKLQLALGEQQGLAPGPTLPERRAAQAEAQTLISRGRAMWQAAMDERSWARWRKKEG